MKKSNPNQKTLFQSWGRKSQTTSTSTTTRQQQPQQNAGFDPLEIIDLGDDDEDDGLLAAAMEMETIDQNTFAAGTSSSSNVDNVSMPKEIEHIPGFDEETGNVWIYPTNYPIRDYQFQIVENALYRNTLVTLPTGLGKTFIAAVLMYNYYRWYPQGKVIFMAPTKPLVAQQIEACYNIMGIPESDTSQMTGNMAPSKRESSWKTKRVFFLTPQVLQNDLARGSCDAENVVLLVFDEAHKALGNHSYCQVVREIYNYTRQFRVLALSATPGDDIKAVQQVMTNLLISHMELRSEDSPDIQAYTHKRTVDKIVVPLGEHIIRIKTQFLKVLGGIVGRLFCNRVLWQKDPQMVSKFMLLSGRNKFREREAEGYTNGQKGAIEGDFAMGISLYHAYELLHQHGILSFYNFIKAIVDGSKGMARARTEIRRHTDFMEVLEELQQLIEKPADEMSAETSALFSQFTSPRRRSMMREAFDPSFRSHPKLLKLEEVIVDHFQNFVVENAVDGEEVNTRVMIFSQYRDSVGEITAILNKHKPLVRVMSFIGQASTGKSSRGLSQKEQLEVIQRFRKGGYNTLVATCVGEEGLDIGDVDLIVCFDAHASPIRLVQRMGRTGRKRNGRIVVLVTEGKEDQIYKRSLSSKKSIHKAIVQGTRSFELYDDSPRMVPRHLTPRVHKMEMTVGKYVGNVKTKRKSEANNTKGNISNYLSKSTSSKSSTSTRKDDGLLTYEELTYWQENFKLPNCEAGTTPARRRKSRDSLSDPAVNRLSLSEWMPWQNVPSPVDKIAHSRRTKHMIEILQFVELHNGEDDAYDVEMMSFLNEEDLPGVDDGSLDNIDDAPMIILDDGDEVRLGNSTDKKKNPKTKRKGAKDNNAAESKKKKRTSAESSKNKVKQSKEETKKSKENKKTSPQQKWREYLKAFENEDNDFEPVDTNSTVGDHAAVDSTETSNKSVTCGANSLNEEQEESAVEKEKVDMDDNCDAVTPENIPTEEEIEEDDTFLSSQQVSQLLPSVTPHAFHSKILSTKNCVIDVPTPPSLDSLNEISPFISSQSIEHEKQSTKRDKIAACRRNIQKDAEKDRSNADFADAENANLKSRKLEPHCEIEREGKAQKPIIEEPPDLFEFDENDEDLSKDGYNSDEGMFEFQNKNHTERSKSKKTNNDNFLEEPESLFELDLIDNILDNNKSERVELSNNMEGDFQARCKSHGRSDILDVPDIAQLDDLQDDFTELKDKTSDNGATFGAGIVCPTVMKSFIDDFEVDFGDESLNDGLLAECIPDDTSGHSNVKSIKGAQGDIEDDTSDIQNNILGKQITVESKNSTITKSQLDKKAERTSKNIGESSSKLLTTSLKSSISKLSAFERDERTSDSLDKNSCKDNSSTDFTSKTVAESSRMIPTTENRKQDKFEFKKPCISMVNRYPKSPSCSGLNQSNRESLVSKMSLSKTTSASSKLSLKNTADHGFEKTMGLSDQNVSPKSGKEMLPKERSTLPTQEFSNEKINNANSCSTDNYVALDESSTQIDASPVSKSQLKKPLRERLGFCGTHAQNQISPSRATNINTYSDDEDSPIARKYSNSKTLPNISTPSRTINIDAETEEDSPIVRKRPQSKTLPNISTPSRTININSETEEDSPIVRKRPQSKTLPNISTPSRTININSETEEDSPIVRKRPQSKTLPNISTPTRSTDVAAELIEEDSPIVRKRPKSKQLLSMSSPASPYNSPLSTKILHEEGEDSPLVRRRSKIKKKNGDVVAVAESDEEDEVETVSIEKRSFHPEKRAKEKKDQNLRSRRQMVLSDSEDEFMVGTHKQGFKENTEETKKGKQIFEVQTSVKRKRQPSDIPSKKQRTHQRDDFLDDEAELSGSDIEDFSDESDYGDEFDSFIDDATQLTQRTPTQATTKKRKSSHDMLAVYRQSLFSPLARGLNFKTPTMHRSKNKYKMKYKVGISEGSPSEAEETWERESDLENELSASEEEYDEGDTSLLEDDVDDYTDGDNDESDHNNDKSKAKDSTPVASQVTRPLKRVKRKRILNESTEDDESDTAKSPLVPPLKARTRKAQDACSVKQSSFVKSSALCSAINNTTKKPPTSVTNPQSTSSNVSWRPSLEKSKCTDDDGNQMPTGLSTTFEFDWGLDFSDSDLLDAVGDDKNDNVADNPKENAKDDNNKKVQVCDVEMEEIAFAMAATDDDVNMDMSEMPTFSLGLDLFDDMDDDIDAPANTSTTVSDNSFNNNATKPRNTEGTFTKISPKSIFNNSSRTNTSATNAKNCNPSTTKHITNNHSTSSDLSLNNSSRTITSAANAKNCSPSTTKHITNNPSTSSDLSLNNSSRTITSATNAKNCSPSTTKHITNNHSTSSDLSLNNSSRTITSATNAKNCNPCTTKHITNNGLHMNRNTTNNGPGQVKTGKGGVSVVRPNNGSLGVAQSNTFSHTSTSSARSKSTSDIRPGWPKDVTNLTVKPGGSSTRPVPTAFVSPSQKDKGKLVMLADTKEISVSQVVSFLRRQHNIKVEVCQLQHCDYAVSNRMGVIRKLASAVSNGANSTKILDKMRILCDLYDRPCFIIEKDRVKTGEFERDFSKSNSYIYTLACMAQTHIKVLFSQSQEETASLLNDLATLEVKKGTHIVAPLTMNKETQQVFRFLLTIPRVSYVTALNMCSSLRTMRDLLACSAEDLLKSTRQLNQTRAAEIHSYLRHVFNDTMVNKNIKLNS